MEATERGEGSERRLTEIEGVWEIFGDRAGGLRVCGPWGYDPEPRVTPVE
jgi:hypothetical protein